MTKKVKIIAVNFAFLMSQNTYVCFLNLAHVGN